MVDRKVLNHPRAVLRLRKGKCLLWAACMVPRTAAKVIYRGWFLWLFVPLAAILVAVRWRTFRGLSRDPPDLKSVLRLPAVLQANCWLAIFFYAGSGRPYCFGFIRGFSARHAECIVPAPLSSLFVFRQVGFIHSRIASKNAELSMLCNDAVGAGFRLKPSAACTFTGLLAE